MNTQARQINSSIISKIKKQRNKLEFLKTQRNMELAARIDDAIKAKSWKKTRLAEAMDKRPFKITKWLSGTHNFTLDTLYSLEIYLGIPLIEVSVKKIEFV
jgi:ribosome-binding protein aMBF1 (putative translation factor)